MLLKQLSLLSICATSLQTLQASVSTLTYHNNQSITYIGTNHSNNPNDAQYALLIAAWNDFIQKTSGKNCCVIIEQPTIAPLIINSLEEAITNYGDCGAAYYLAKQATIPLLAGDPLARLGFPLLLTSERWDPDYVRYSCFIQQLELCLRAQEIKKSTKPILESVEKKFGAIFPGTSIEIMITLHEKITGKVFNPYDHHFFKFLTYYPPPKTIRGFFLYRFKALKELRKIVFDYHLKREIATIALIKQQLLAGKHVFVVFGNAHEAFHLKALEVITKGKATPESAKKLYVDQLKYSQSQSDTEDAATVAALFQAIQ